MSAFRRGAGWLFLATALGHISQFAWLIAASRTMDAERFGQVLAALVLYAVLQIVVDNGPAALGARLAAQGRLEDADRATLVRLRLLLAAVAIPVGLALGASGAGGSLLAVAPFMVALLLFALLDVWEPYGSGDVRPWASYMLLRSLLPAAAALGLLAAGTRFPTVLAGLLECAVILAVGIVARRPLWRHLGPAFRARGLPWRGAFAIGVPAVLQQASVAMGTLALGAAGRPALAGAFAVCIRMLTGINGLLGVLTTSLYPRLAGDRLAGGERSVGAVLGVLVAVVSAATAVTALAAGPIVLALLGRRSEEAEAALVVTTSVAAAMSIVVLATYVLVAGERERQILRSYLAGTVATGLAIVVLLVLGDPTLEALALALGGGQLVTMSGLLIACGEALPRAPVALLAGGSAAWALVSVAIVTVEFELPALAVVAGVLGSLAALAVTRRNLRRVPSTVHATRVPA